MLEKLSRIGKFMARRYAKDQIEEAELYNDFLLAVLQVINDESYRDLTVDHLAKIAMTAGKNEIIDEVRRRNIRHKKNVCIDEMAELYERDVIPQIELKIIFDDVEKKLEEKERDVLIKLRLGEEDLGVNRMFVSRLKKKIRGILDD